MRIKLIAFLYYMIYQIKLYKFIKILKASFLLDNSLNRYWVSDWAYDDANSWA